MSRRRGLLRPAAALAAAIAAGFLAARIPTDYFLMTPGVTRSISALVTVAGGKKDSRGRFVLTTVAAQPANLWLYLYGKAHPQADLEPSSKILGPDGDLRRYREETRAMMEESQGTATVAALRALGYPARVIGGGARVTSIIAGGPAAGKLRPGDVIVAVDGEPVEFAEQLIDRLSRARVGAEVGLTVRRGDESLQVRLVTVEHPDRPGRSAIRAGVADARLKFDLPVEVRIDADGITGPSAGLMFALEIIDQLAPDDLTRGRVVAGTGTITPDGRVGPIGGIRQKAIAAERAGAAIFLAPRDDAAKAAQVAARMKVVPVGTLQEALDALRSS